MSAPFTSLESWRPRMAREEDLPTGFLMAWLKHESYGNPCSVGRVLSNGYVKEAGIGQLYYPDDERYGATLEQVRVTCSGSTQRETRALTEGEREQYQAAPFIAYVRARVEKTEKAMAAVGASWTRADADFWMFVKLYHGLPGINNVLWPAFARVHGRAPHSFAEFAAWCTNLSDAAVQGYVDAGHTWVRQYRGAFAKVFANATKTGAAAGPVRASEGGGSLSLYAIPVVGILFRFLAKLKGGG